MPSIFKFIAFCILLAALFIAAYFSLTSIFQIQTAENVFLVNALFGWFVFLAAGAIIGIAMTK